MSPGTLPPAPPRAPPDAGSPVPPRSSPESSSSSPTPRCRRRRRTSRDGARARRSLRRSFAPSAPSDGPSFARPSSPPVVAREPGHLSRALLADARVVRRRDGTTAGANSTWWRRPGGARRWRASGRLANGDAWIRALEDAAVAVGTRVGTQGADSSGCERGENDWSEGRGPSTALGDTRGVGGDARVAVALAENLAEGRHTVWTTRSARDHPRGRKHGRGRGRGRGGDGAIRIRSVVGTIPGRNAAGAASVLETRRARRLGQLSLQLLDARDDAAARGRSSTWTRLAAPWSVRPKHPVPAMVLRRSFEVRDVATPRAARVESPRVAPRLRRGGILGSRRDFRAIRVRHRRRQICVRGVRG